VGVVVTQTPHLVHHYFVLTFPSIDNLTGGEFAQVV